MARLHSPDAGALGWIPAWGAKSYLPQLRARMPRHTENPMCGNEEAVQPNQYILKKKKRNRMVKIAHRTPQDRRFWNPWTLRGFLTGLLRRPGAHKMDSVTGLLMPASILLPRKESFASIRFSKALVATKSIDKQAKLNSVGRQCPARNHQDRWGKGWRAYFPGDAMPSCSYPERLPFGFN